LTKLLPYILFEKYIHILALEMASSGNQHCDNCIGALSFTISAYVIGAGIIAAAAGARLACQWILDKGFKVYSLQLHYFSLLPPRRLLAHDKQF